MPHTYKWEPAGLYRKFTGEISGDEILESNLELHVHPKFSAIKYIINDFTEITGHTIEIAHTRAYATSDEIISNTKGKLKIALLVAGDEQMALASNYCDLMQGKWFETKIFQDLGEARKWVAEE